MNEEKSKIIAELADYVRSDLPVQEIIDNFQYLIQKLDYTNRVAAITKARLWNLWHFRNYKDDDVSFGEKVKRILVRIVIYTIIVLIVLQLLYVLVTMMVK